MPDLLQVWHEIYQTFRHPEERDVVSFVLLEINQKWRLKYEHTSFSLSSSSNHNVQKKKGQR